MCVTWEDFHNGLNIMVLLQNVAFNSVVPGFEGSHNLRILVMVIKVTLPPFQFVWPVLI